MQLFLKCSYGSLHGLDEFRIFESNRAGVDAGSNQANHEKFSYARIGLTVHGLFGTVAEARLSMPTGIGL